MWPNRSFLRIWSHLLKKSLMGNLIFCAVENGNFAVRGALPSKGISICCLHKDNDGHILLSGQLLKFIIRKCTNKKHTSLDVPTDK